MHLLRSMIVNELYKVRVVTMVVHIDGAGAKIVLLFEHFILVAPRPLIIIYLLIFQYIVVPPRRSTAEAFQILISHMFGDAGSPYLVGVVRNINYFLKSPEVFKKFY